MPLLTAIVLTLNEAAHLPDCLASLAFADAVLVFDSFSSDRTTEIAGAAGARVVQHAFTDYAAQRNAALDAVQSDWVFFVDADERVPAQLAQEVRSATMQPDVAAWWVPRHNYILGRLTLHAGWFPDYQLRLLRPDCVRYDSSRPVHELALVTGASAQLAQPLIHLNYATIREFVSKQRVYAGACSSWHVAGGKARACASTADHGTAPVLLALCNACGLAHGLARGAARIANGPQRMAQLPQFAPPLRVASRPRQLFIMIK
ncbi:uncharacterized glycosyltransferase HI_0653 [Anaerolineaceae bacterium]|nr:uncharacterized glycosyltransferase HI_0653 [Anaerolineaceae bacterium]